MSFFSTVDWDSKVGKDPTLPACGKCALYKKCYSPKMEPSGSGRRKVLFIAEAPGETEDRQGTQLVGKAGEYFRKQLKLIDKELEDCWKTNAIICRPPENKMESAYVEYCRPNVLQAIDRLKPTVIALLGKSALESVLPTIWGKTLGSLNKWVGWTIPSQKYKAWICPTYHPSFLLRMDSDQVLESMMETHLEKIFDLEEDGPPDTPTLKELQDQVEIITNQKTAYRRIKSLLDKSGVLAFDYETTGLKPDAKEQRIVSCSFCLDGKETFAVMTEHPKVFEMLSKVLRSPKLLKVASNAKFENRWTIAKLGHRVRAWYWDTMLAAHMIDNRSGITSVKFQAFVLLGIGEYDSHVSSYLTAPTANSLNNIHKVDPKDLLMYNGLDSLLEYLVMEKQREILDDIL